MMKSVIVVGLGVWLTVGTLGVARAQAPAPPGAGPATPVRTCHAAI